MRFNVLQKSTVLCGIVLLAGCSGGDGDEPESDVQADTNEVADDVETSDDADTSEGVTNACEADAECVDSRCIAGECRAIECNFGSGWVPCRDKLEAIEPGLGRYAFCDEKADTDALNYCRAGCITDDMCPEGNICSDFGRCAPFDGSTDFPAPAPVATGELSAGFAEGRLNFPVGLPLGGYGERAATNDGRYAVSLRASWGQFHGMDARATVLDNGDQKLMFIRLPIIFLDGDLHEDVARALEEKTGEDWRHNLMISATHTHSGPCRHWHLPPRAALPLGTFGIGEFNQYAYDWLRDETVKVALAAVDNLQPAKLGWTIVEAYDTDDTVARDRWDQSPPFDDNRLLLMRIDNLEDEPLGVMFSFGAHATDNSSDYFTGDILDGAERALNHYLSERYGRYIPTMFLNQNSGTMGPAGDTQGHDYPQTMGRVGSEFVRKASYELELMETKREISLGAANLRFPINYDLLGYEPGEWGGSLGAPLGGEYHYGGLSCADSQGGDQDYESHSSLDTLECVGALQFLLLNQPPTTLMRSHIMAGEIDGLTFATVPGETSMELGWQMLRALRDEFEVDPLKAWNFGYTNDHLFYLLPTNLRGELPVFPGISTPMAPDDYPDFAFSYLQGGYESGMSPWGPRTGDFLVERVVDAYRYFKNPAAPELTFEQPLPKRYTYREFPQFEVFLTPATDIGRIVEDVPAAIERFETLEFAWVGGDPGAEQPQMPEVTLERNVEGTWETLTISNTRPYSNYEGEMLTRIRPEGDDLWEWVIRWEELSSFPTGTYRFKVTGHYQESNGAEGRKPYELTSAEFEVLPSDAIVIEPAITATGISGRVGYPRDEKMRFDGPAGDPARVTGNYRLRNPEVPTGSITPLDAAAGSTITVTRDGVELFAGPLTTVTNLESDAGRNNVPVSRFTAAFPESIGAGPVTVAISVTDSWGNIGTLTTDLVIE